MIDISGVPLEHGIRIRSERERNSEIREVDRLSGANSIPQRHVESDGVRDSTEVLRGQIWRRDEQFGMVEVVFQSNRIGETLVRERDDSPPVLGRLFLSATCTAITRLKR